MRLPVSLAVPDLRLPRAAPCSALVFAGQKIECGATPSSLYLRSCGVPSHERRIWLCPVHAAIAASGAALCRECGARAGVRAVRLVRLTAPVRLP